MRTGLIQMLQSEQPILMDGALGTELERRGVPIEERGWSAMALRDHGAIVQSVHEDYLRAGSKIHIANSFALARHVLKPIGLADEFEWFNRHSVELFDRAVSALDMERSTLWLAGSISTFSAASDRSNLPESKQLARNCLDQAEILANAGVDLFALEMLFDEEVSTIMLEAVRSFDLPVILGFTCEWENSGNKDVVVTRGLDGLTRQLGEVLTNLRGMCQFPGLIPAIMHSDIDVTNHALGVLRRHFTGPLAVYPNSGEFSNLRMNFDTVCSPTQFADASMQWLQSKAAIVGGCCGIGPRHIAELHSRMSVNNSLD